MHIISMFENAVEKKNSVQVKMNNLAIELMQSGCDKDKELAKKIFDLNREVTEILTPFTE